MGAPEKNEIRRYLDLVLQRRFLFTAVAVIACTLGVAWVYLQPERYEAKSTVFIERSVLDNLFQGMAVTRSIEDRLRVLSYALNSRSLLQKVIQDLDVDLVGEAGSTAAMVERFQRNTEINVKDADLFTITYRDENPRLAQDYVNTLIRKYIEENLSSSREGSYGANRFLQEQMEHFRARLQEAEGRLTAYRRQQHYLIGMDESVLMGELRTLGASLEELGIRKNELLARQQVLNRGAQGSASSTEYLAELQRRRDQLLLTYTERYPEVQLVDAEIAQVRQALRTGKAPEFTLENSSVEASLVAIELDALLKREEQLRRDLDERKAILSSLPEKRRVLNELERDRNALRETYDQLVTRYGRSEVSVQMELQDKAGTFRIVDPAMLPQVPISPNRIPLLLLCLAGGIGIGFVVVYALDYFDSSLKGIDEVQAIGLPVLALIPKVTTMEERVRERKKTVALTAFVAAYLAGFTLVLLSEFLQGMGFSAREAMQAVTQERQAALIAVLTHLLS